MQQAPARPRRVAGFTLIELMIAVAVVALLAAVALPAFQSAIRKGRRSDAIAALSAVQQAQERVRASWPQYCGTLAAPAGNVCGLNLPATSANGHYSVAISNDSATGYVATATAVGSQAADAGCAVMAVKMDSGALSYGSGSSSVDWTDANRCWAK